MATVVSKNLTDMTEVWNTYNDKNGLHSVDYNFSKKQTLLPQAQRENNDCSEWRPEYNITNVKRGKTNQYSHTCYSIMQTGRGKKGQGDA